MNLNILQLLTLFSSFLLFLLGIIFLFYPHGKKISNYLLGAFMLSNAVLLADFFSIITFPLFTKQFPIISNLGFHSYLLLAPLLYLYIISLCSQDLHFSLKTLLHFSPFIVIVCLAFFITVFTAELAAYMPKTGYYFNMIYKPFLYLQIAAYIIASFIALRKYRSQLKELYSSLIKIDLMWINLVLSFLILMWSTDVVIYIVNTFDLVSVPVSHFLTYQTISINLILCISLIYKGMIQTTVPSGIVSKPKYGQSKADFSGYQEYRKLLSQIMETEKPYLLPELNLDELSKRLNISSKQLSQTIHVCFNQNFNSYINQYRVEEAKWLMESDSQNKKTLFEILFDAGFNSKSVFNESFKKNSGFTPKEYRKKINK